MIALLAGCGSSPEATSPGSETDADAGGTFGLPRADAGVDAGSSEGGAKGQTDSGAIREAAAGGADATGAPPDGGDNDAESGIEGGGADAGDPVIAIPLSTPDGTYYTAQVTLGNQTFTLDVDTGSATLGVAGQGCQSCTTEGVSELYMPSAAAVSLHRSVSTTYGDGSSWSGNVFEDKVGLGHGAPDVQLDLADIQNDSQFFHMATFQGILGMGPSELEEPGTQAYLPRAIAAGIEPAVAFELCATSGTMWLGGFDPSAAASSVEYTPLRTIGNSNPFYTIDVDDLSVGGTSLGFHTADFQSPIVDTGTSLFYLPTRVFDALVSAVSKSPGYASVFGQAQLTGNGCVQARSGTTAAAVDAALPAIAVKLPNQAAGAQDFTLTLQPAESYLLDAGRGLFCLAVGDGGAMDGAIFGDVFLSSFLTIIDVQNGRVGLAPDSGCGSPLGRRVIDRATWHPRPPRPRRRH